MTDSEYPHKILIAEDNPTNQILAIAMLKNLGFKADCVDDGEKAVTAHKKEGYDLILMDCQMPKMDGYEATKVIRSLPGDQGAIPIVAMTAHAMVGDDVKCLEAGMDHYITKPVELDNLLKILKKSLSLE